MKALNDRFAGSGFLDSGRMIEQLQPATAVVECSSQVFKRPRPQKGSKARKTSSPYEHLVEVMQSYYLVPFNVDSSTIVSPITGAQSVVHKTNAIILCFHRDDYTRAPEEAECLYLQAHDKPFAAFDMLDRQNEGEAYQVMHYDDQRDLEFEFRMSPSGIVYVARLADAPKGRGVAAYINDVVDLESGLAPTATAAAPYSWVVMQMNGRSEIRRTTLREYARGYLLRGIPES